MCNHVLTIALQDLRINGRPCLRSFSFDCLKPCLARDPSESLWRTWPFYKNCLHPSNLVCSKLAGRVLSKASEWTGWKCWNMRTALCKRALLCHCTLMHHSSTRLLSPKNNTITWRVPFIITAVPFTQHFLYITTFTDFKELVSVSFSPPAVLDKDQPAWKITNLRNEHRRQNSKLLGCWRNAKVSGTVHCMAINTEYKYFTCTWAQTHSTIQRQSTKGTRQVSLFKTQRSHHLLRFSEFS